MERRTGDQWARRLDGRPSPTNLVDLFEPQLRQFVAAIQFGDQPVVSGLEGRRSIELLSACYQSRQLWTHPWDAGVPATTIAGIEGVVR